MHPAVPAAVAAAGSVAAASSAAAATAAAAVAVKQIGPVGKFKNRLMSALQGGGGQEGLGGRVARGGRVTGEGRRQSTAEEGASRAGRGNRRSTTDQQQPLFSRKSGNGLGELKLGGVGGQAASRGSKDTSGDGSVGGGWSSNRSSRSGGIGSGAPGDHQAGKGANGLRERSRTAPGTEGDLIEPQQQQGGAEAGGETDIRLLHADDMDSMWGGVDNTQEHGALGGGSTAAAAEKMTGGFKRQHGLDFKSTTGKGGSISGAVSTNSSSGGAITVNMLSAMEAVRQSWLHEEQQRQQFSSNGGITGSSSNGGLGAAAAGRGLGRSISGAACKHPLLVSSRSNSNVAAAAAECLSPVWQQNLSSRTAPTIAQLQQQQGMGSGKSFNLGAGLRAWDGNTEGCSSPAWMPGVRDACNIDEVVQGNAVPAAAAAEGSTQQGLPKESSAAAAGRQNDAADYTSKQAGGVAASPWAAPKARASVNLLELDVCGNATAAGAAAADEADSSVSPSSKGIRPILRSNAATPRTTSARHRVQIKERSAGFAADEGRGSSSTSEVPRQVLEKQESAAAAAAAEARGVTVYAEAEEAALEAGAPASLPSLYSAPPAAAAAAVTALTVPSFAAADRGPAGYRESAPSSPAAASGSRVGSTGGVAMAAAAAYYRSSNRNSRSSGGGSLPQAVSSSIFNGSSSGGISWPQQQQQLQGTSTRRVQLPFVAGLQAQPSSSSGSFMLLQPPPALLLTDADDVAAPALGDEQTVDAECYSPATPCEGGKRNAVMMRRLHKKKSLKRLEAVMLGVAAHQGEEDAEEVAAAALAEY